MSGQTEKDAVAQTADKKVSSEATETTNVEANGADGQTKKVNRRGVSTARGTQRLKFTHELAKPNGLFLATLLSVDLTTITIGEDKSGMPSFNGMDIPRLLLTFCSPEEDPNKRHFVTLSFTAVESNVKTIPGGSEEWKVNAIFDWFKHLLNVFVLKGREMTEQEEEALGLSFEDFDEQGEYSPIEAEDVVEGWKQLFENVANMLNTSKDGKPAYKDKAGKPLPLWIKLLRYNKTKKGWTAINNGDLSFPTFIGEGAIEVFVQNAKTSIRVDTIKEAIHPMNIEKAKAPNMGGGGIPSMGGPAMGQFGGGPAMNNISADADSDDDMPF